MFKLWELIFFYLRGMVLRFMCFVYLDLKLFLLLCYNFNGIR